MSSPKKKGKKPPRSTNMLDRLEECERGGQFELDLGGLKISAWPAETIIVPNIAVLKAHGNNFTTIPTLEGFRGLDTINISRNKIIHLNDTKLSSLHRLKYLDLSRNQLESIPEDITELPLLVSLNVSRNKIATVPKDMAPMRSLKTLDLSSNALTIVGDVFDGPPQLEELNLSDNPDMDLKSMSDKSRRMHEKRQLFRSKASRRVLIGRALGIRKDVLVREQEHIQNEIAKATATHGTPNPFP